METQIINATEYRNLPLALLTESTTNPRKIFDEVSLKELADYASRVHNGDYVPLPLLWPTQ